MTEIAANKEEMVYRQNKSRNDPLLHAHSDGYHKNKQNQKTSVNKNMVIMESVRISRNVKW